MFDLMLSSRAMGYVVAMQGDEMNETPILASATIVAVVD